MFKLIVCIQSLTNYFILIKQKFIKTAGFNFKIDIEYMYVEIPPDFVRNDVNDRCKKTPLG